MGFKEIRLSIAIESDASPEERRKLLELTERYCVVYQTLSRAPHLTLVSQDATIGA